MKNKLSKLKAVILPFLTIFFIVFLLLISIRSCYEKNLYRESHITSSNELDSILNNLSKSNILFNPPQNLYLEKDYPIFLWASERITEKVLKDSLKNFAKEKNLDSIEFHRIRTGSKIEALLTGGKAFEIVNGSPDQQPISEFNITKWEWNVTPEKKGLQTLILTINAVINYNGIEEKMVMNTYRREINVEVEKPIKYFFKKNNDIILASFFTVILSLASYIFGYEKRKKKSKKNKK